MNKKALKKSLAGLMIVAVLSGTMAPVSLIFATDKTRADKNMEELKLHRIDKNDLEKVIGKSQKANLSESKKKLSTDLLRLIDDNFLLPNQKRTQVVSQMKELKQFIAKENSVKTLNRKIANKAHNDLVYVYVKLNPSTQTSIIDSVVWEVTDRDEKNHLAVALVEVDKLETLAFMSGVKNIRSVLLPVVRSGSVVTEGDLIHQTDDVRSAYSQNGAGIKIGVISDGVDNIASAQSSGDLPTVTVFDNSNGGDEGTAMLEIIHDMVPDAQLYFHTGFPNAIVFNNAVNDLAAAGVDVIVDDLGFFDQPYFEDGTIASNIASALATNNIVYVSAAGNAGNAGYDVGHHQSNYYNNGSNFHDFSAGLNQVLVVNIPNGGIVTPVLQWNDNFGSSSNDYDLYLFNQVSGVLLGGSEIVQNGNDDPLETFSFTNTSGSTIIAGIYVRNYNAMTKTLEVFVLPKNGTQIYNNNLTPADSIFGHPAVPNVIAVGAIAADDPGNDTIESFSSQGPVTIIGEGQRAKPDIAGIDKVLITGAGGFGAWDGSNYRFPGTSAAAPHIAAIAAQLWGQYPSATGDQIREHLLNTAVDLGDTGFDTIFGYGRADALLAFEASPTISATFDDGDGFINDTDLEAFFGVNIDVMTTNVEDGQNVSCDIVSSDGESESYGPVIGTIASNVATISSGELTMLNDGTLTVSCSVANLAGISAVETSDTSIKDTILPVATLSNMPANPTDQTTTDITVGNVVGTETVTHYKYSMNGGDYGDETPVNENIQLVDLADGTHTLFVIGRDEAGNWQTQVDPTSHTWIVNTVPADTTAPIRSNPSPTEELSSGITETVISLSTDENATCKYSETAETDYSSMLNTFSTTGETAHSTTVTGLLDGQSYTYYVRCEDEIGNFNIDDFAISFSVAEIINTPPVMQSVILSPTTVYTNTDIIATAVASDSDVGDIITFSYQWKKSFAVGYDFEDMAGETDATLSSDNFVKGNIIKAVVTPNDGTENGEPMTSETLTISNSIPTQPTVFIDPNPAYADDDLICNPSGSTDADDDEFSYEHQWYKNGVAKEYSSTVLASETTADDVWKCEVVAYDGEAQSVVGEDSVTIIETPTNVEVSGVITENTTWRLINSPYIVTGNILVNEGVTLTIEPGVVVKFKDHSVADYYGYYIKIDGTLAAKGTEENMITFTSNNIDDDPINWGAIHFSDKSIDWNDGSEMGNIMEYCIVEYGGKDNDFGNTLITIRDSSPLVKNSILRLSNHDALRISNGNPKIIGNKIENGRIMAGSGSAYFSENEVTGKGFYIVSGGTPTITKNNIINNQGDPYSGGMRIDENSCPIITYNNIVSNSDNGIAFVSLILNEPECSPIISNNNIYSNEKFSVFLHNYAANIDASNNWWGTIDENLISASIYDKDDDFNLGEINYLPFLTVPEPNVLDITIDIISPVITLSGNDPINLYTSDTYVDAGATAEDNIDGDITNDIIIVNPVDTNTIGIYTITYNVSDSAGNPAEEVTRTVIVSEAPDTTPPVRSNSSPTGVLSVETTQTTLSLTTDENATCRYSTVAGTEYSAMTGVFDTTGSTNHSTLVTDLTNGDSYTYYIKCQDNSDNNNTDDYEISFSVASPPAPSGGVGSYTPPTSVSSVNNPLKITSTQQGTLTQNLNNENKVKVEIPKGSIESTTTFTASEGSLEEGDIPKDKMGAFLFNGLVFNVEAIDASNNAVREFSEDLTITLTIPDLPDDISSLELYYYDDESGEWIIITDIEFGDDTITFKVNHLTQFAVFETNATKVSSTSGTSEVKGVTTTEILDGDIIQCKSSDNPFAVYIVKIVGDTKYIRHIVSLEIFNYYEHLKWENLKQVESLNNYSLSGWVRYNTGENYTAAPTDKVYEINGDQTRHWINMTAEQFLSHGGSEPAIFNINQGELNLYITGADVMSL